MTVANAIGTTGVALLLLAFGLNAFGRLPHESRGYHALNAVGAALACIAAVLIGFVPFIVLDGIWTIVALAALLRRRGRC